LKQAEKAVAANPKNLTLLAARGKAYYRVGRDADALRDLSAVLSKSRSLTYYEGHYYRARVHARLGNFRAALADYNLMQQRKAPLAKAWGAAILILAPMGLEGQMLASLEALLKTRPTNASFLFEAARTSAQLAVVLQPVQAAHVAAAVGSPSFFNLYRLPQQSTTAHASADRAVALLRQALAAGYASYANLLTEPDLDPVRRHPDFQALLRECHFERLYSAVWYSSTTQTGRDSHGLGLASHLARCRQLAKEGYQPTALAVAEVTAGKPLVTASMWRRAVRPRAERNHLASRQGNAATALAQLGRPEPLWPLLKHQPDPQVRSYLVGRLGRLGLDPRVLLGRLGREEDVSARRALLLGLGQCDVRRLPAEMRRAWDRRLLTWYVREADAGLHGALDWLLRQRWGLRKELERIDRELSGKRPTPPPTGVGAPTWFVNTQGQTFTRVAGPVEFLMGSPPHEAGRKVSEKAHRRRIGRSFALASKPVTVRQYLAFLKANPKVKQPAWERYSPDRDGPMNSLTWYDAAQYCRWLSEKEGVPPDQMCYPSIAVIEKAKNGRTPLKLPADYLKRTGYRLPTEAEWEYACRAEAASSRFFGSDAELLVRHGWCIRNGQDRTWPVGRKLPNDFGLFDTYGNVFQWCQERYLTYPASRSGQPVEDVEDNAAVTGTVNRVLRGGSFLTPPADIRSAARFSNQPTSSHPTHGFRLARTCR
jgi:formylglycine-generating enzyme required for sulfatase activity/tetratricopeptide (TPR) repeat protein